MDPIIIYQKFFDKILFKELYKRNRKTISMQKLLPNLSDITSPKKLEKKILEYLNKNKKII